MQLVGQVGTDGLPVEMDAIANWKLSPKSKLWGWCKAFGMEPILGTSYDTDSIVGEHALAVVERRDTPNEEWSRITDFVPMPKMAASAPDQNNFLTYDANSDAHVDWGHFWAPAKKVGITPAILRREAGVEKVEDIDPARLPALLVTLTAKAKRGPLT